MVPIASDDQGLHLVELMPHGDQEGCPGCWDWRGDEILDTEEVQGNSAAQEKINSNRVPMEKKESVRWLDNLRQSIE